MSRCVMLIGAILIASSMANAQMIDQSDSSKNEVHRALSAFLTAFENLDWEAFRSHFHDSATVFFPSPEPPQRFDGRRQIEERFSIVFDGIRKNGTGKPPYQTLEPRNLRIVMCGDQVAIATFELENSQRIARRTIVFQKFRVGWQIVHLHASNVPVKPIDSTDKAGK